MKSIPVEAGDLIKVNGQWLTLYEHLGTLFVRYDGEVRYPNLEQGFLVTRSLETSIITHYAKVKEMP